MVTWTTPNDWDNNQQESGVEHNSPHDDQLRKGRRNWHRVNSHPGEAFYKMKGSGATISDVGPNNHHGSLAGGDRINLDAYLNYIFTSWIDVSQGRHWAAPNQVMSGSRNYTFECFFRPTGNTNLECILLKENDVSVHYRNGTIDRAIGVNNLSSGAFHTFHTGQVNHNSWNHVAVILHSGGQMECILNGVHANVFPAGDFNFGTGRVWLGEDLAGNSMDGFIATTRFSEGDMTISESLYITEGTHRTGKKVATATL